MGVCQSQQPKPDTSSQKPSKPLLTVEIPVGPDVLFTPVVTEPTRLRSFGSSAMLNITDEMAVCARAWNVEESTLWQHVHTAKGDRNLLFCLAKGIIRRVAMITYECEDKQHQTLPQMDDDMYLTWLASNNPSVNKVHHTLDVLLNPPLQHFYQVPTEVCSFDKFVGMHPQWAKSDMCFVFFRDHETVKNKQGVLIQRAHLKENHCYIHGPIVLQHYLLSMNVNNATTIDIRNFVLQHVDLRSVLSKLICHVEGGYSRDILHQLTPGHNCEVTNSFQEAEHCLQRFGPGLVINFKIEQNFHDNSNTSYVGSFTSTNVGFHCMVLVGMREDKDGKRYILLQNWWKTKQWVECDHTYFRASGAVFLFYKDKITAMPPGFVTTDEIYAETYFAGNDLLPEESNTH